MNVIMVDVEQILLQGRYDEAQLARALLDRYYAPLYNISFSILKDSGEADDIVQETLLAALNKIDQYEPGTNLKTWLSRIAVNRCRDVLRKRKVREKFYAIWLGSDKSDSPPRGPEVRTADHELAGELWQAVDQLNDKHRLPIIFHYVHDMTAGEIAAVLGIKEGTVYSRLHYACRKLEIHFSDTELKQWAKEVFNE
jgi:RNA polymerase sigma-70 factor (ECF subfamily)